MKKTISALLLIMLMITNISAKNLDCDFEITSGIDISKKSEATFDSSRIISGTAEKGTVIYFKTECAGKVVSEYETKVGSSRYFSFSADFEIGRNDIEITAVMPDGTKQQINTAVKRKNSEIKSQLESNISLPGESLKRG